MGRVQSQKSTTVVPSGLQFTVDNVTVLPRALAEDSILDGLILASRVSCTPWYTTSAKSKVIT